VSKRHAELFFHQAGIWVRDLGSTNGTSVNGERIQGERRLEEGDVLEFARLEFRLVKYRANQVGLSLGTRALDDREISEALRSGLLDLRETVEKRRLETHFQPIVRLDDSSVIGYEALGRGLLGGDLIPPLDLFFVAERLGREVELSLAFREVAVSHCQALPIEHCLFFNTHPRELESLGDLLESVHKLAATGPSLCPVLEIHEGALSDPSAFKALRSELRDLDVKLAFDDFGKGQSRIAELAEVSPDYLKFDLALIHKIHEASPKRRELVSHLVAMAHDLGISPLAEGVELQEEAQVCQDMGFELAQGFLWGHPGPLIDATMAEE
jgi:EAL domain-containing protein (putative c-di-GMP-specific phosphodiesterase class I)